MKRGTQIAYVPMHADGNIGHRDAEFGFVTSVKRDLGVAFCRYWSKYESGDLRTKANSEGTPVDCLVEYESVDQALVDALLETL